MLKTSNETIHGKKTFWENPTLSTLLSNIRWSLRWFDEQTLTIHTKDLTLNVSANPPDEKQPEALKATPFMISAETPSGLRNLINTEFPEYVNMVIGNQRADYPGGSCATYETTCKIIQVLYETGKLDDSVGWDNPPKDTDEIS